MIGTWVGVIIAGIVGIGAAIACIASCESTVGKVGGALISIIIAGVICGGALWWLYGTEAGSRAIKNYESNTKGGIERTVRVYDIKGDLVTEYSGKFDVEHTDGRIVFDDENGKRHIIYYYNGMVIIDEK